MVASCTHRHPYHRGLPLLVALVLALGGTPGCKSNKEEKDIEQIKKSLQKMLKNPVDMHQVKVDQVKQAFTERLEALLKKPDKAARDKLLQEIVGEEHQAKIKLFSDEITAINVSPDNWLVNGEPAAVIVNNRTDEPMVAEVNLGCGAPPKVYPIIATIDTGAKEKTKLVYKEIENKTVKLPAVPAKSKRLYIITTDKTWTPGTHDKRRLGVRLSVSLRPYLASLLKKRDARRRAKIVKAVFDGEVSDITPLVAPHLAAVSLSPDGWTTGLGPSAVVVDNTTDKPMIPKVTVTSGAPVDKHPLTALFDDGKKTHKIRFAKPGHKLVSLPAVPAKSRMIFVVSTDKTFDGAKGHGAQLGVRISNPLDGTMRDLLQKPDTTRRAQLVKDIFSMQVDKINILGDLVAAIGLSGDRWTVDGEPAGLAVRNAGEAPLSIQVNLACGVPDGVGPITAIVDDGDTQQKVTFTQPGSQKVTLSAVAPGARKLYIVTTDKSWSPGTHDKRNLGVNVGIRLGPVLRAVLDGGGAAMRGYLAKAILNGRMMGKTELKQDVMAALGLSADNWTENNQPAAVVVRNPGDKAWTPKITLTVGAPKKDLPLTVTVDDGLRKTKVVFSEADSRTVKLASVPAGKEMLYIVTTDKSWQAPPDPRLLGVSIAVPRDLRAPRSPQAIKAPPAAAQPAAVAPSGPAKAGAAPAGASVAKPAAKAGVDDTKEAK